MENTLVLLAEILFLSAGTWNFLRCIKLHTELVRQGHFEAPLYAQQTLEGMDWKPIIGETRIL